MWIFVDSGAQPGSVNMEFDRWLAREWFVRMRRPVFRLYSWAPPALSIGFHQSLDDIDRERLQAAGYDLVKRPTGGRAILHAEEITYSVVLDASDTGIDRLYEKISTVLVTGLRAAGYDVSFSGNRPHFPSLYRTEGSIPCFSISSEFEIQMKGRKLVGSAQRRYARPDGGITALQHGSILTGPLHKKLADFVRVGETARAGIREQIERATIDLSEATRPVDEIRVKECLIQAAQSELAGGEFEVADQTSMQTMVNNITEPSV
jgi:lipoyl(octanoyl) transferase